MFSSILGSPSTHMLHSKKFGIVFVAFRTATDGPILMEHYVLKRSVLYATLCENVGPMAYIVSTPINFHFARVLLAP